MECAVQLNPHVTMPRLYTIRVEVRTRHVHKYHVLVGTFRVVV